MLITSLENEKVKEIVKLKNRKFRKKTRTFLVEGLHLVLEAFRNNVLVELLLVENEELPLEVKTTYFSEAVMKKLSSLDNPPGIMGICKMKENVEDLGDRVVLLDSIQDPANLGLIIRSALAFGATTLVLSPDAVDLYNPKVIRATQGMIFALNIIIADLEEVLLKLKKQDYSIFGTTVNLGVSVTSIEELEKKKYALVMGNEGRGVSARLLDLCDKNLNIKMVNNVESLNVAVACSILLYELNKRVEWNSLE